MRIVVATTAGTGHIHPVVPVASALQRAGHDVVWATAAASVPMVERFGFAARAAGMEVAERNATFAQRFATEIGALPPRERRPAGMAAAFGTIAAPRMLEQLAVVLDDVRPDLVVHEVAELASPALAAARGIARMTVAFSGALAAPVQAAIATSVAPLWSSVGLAVPADLGLLDGGYLHPFPPAFGQRPDGERVLDARPLHEDGAGGAAAPAWLAELGVRRPLVYVTFGTEFGRFAPWSAVLGAMAPLDVDVVATVGSQLDPSSLGAVPPNVRVERYVPQGALLCRASLVVSHAGAGTMLAAAGHGVAQIAVPIAADQFENADALATSGAGVVVEGADVAAERIADVARRLLADGPERERTAVVAAQIAAMAHPDDVVRGLVHALA